MSISRTASKCGISEVKRSHEIFDFVDSDTMYLPPYRSVHAVKLEEYLGIKEINPSIRLIQAIIHQRNIKSAEEIKYLNQAADLTAKMHKTVMESARAGMKEHELVAIASQFAWQNGARWSFTPIMTINGQTLHNHSYHNTIAEGDLLLFDGGIELNCGYAGDMTRTFPVSKKFSQIQKDIYSIVMKAHDAAVDASKPGVYYKDVHLIAAHEIAKGLTALGLMKGDPEEAVDEGAHTMFFQHGLGHMIGLDVHDMEALGETFVGYDQTIRKSTKFGLKSLRLARPLQEGYAITIEPGIYIIPHLIDLWQAEKKYEDFIDYEKLNQLRDFGGIRIENDYHINSNGAQLLGDLLPYDSDSVEAIRSS